MTADEFENPDSSPVPPYDRTWRHPAELADAARDSHLRTAPPLGRRLTAITVLASVVSSLVVLAIAIPRGVQDYSGDDPRVTTTTVVIVRGSGLTSLGVLGGADGSTSAVSLGSRHWLVATESLRILAASSRKKFSVVRQDRLAGVTIIKLATGSAAPAVDLTHVKDSLTSDELPRYTIVDAFRHHEAAPEPSLSSQSKTGVHPVNMSTPINGIALVLDRMGRVAGVLVRHDHAEWSLTRETLLALAAP